MIALTPKGDKKVFDNSALVESDIIVRAVISRLETMSAWGRKDDLYTEACLVGVPTLVNFVLNQTEPRDAYEMMQAMGPAYLQEFAQVFVDIMMVRTEVNEYYSMADLEDWLFYISQVHKIQVSSSL